MPVDALPTPPHSPSSRSAYDDSDDATKPASHLLDHIQSFYQQEQHWVHHTRAALELTVTKGVDAPALVSSSRSNTQYNGYKHGQSEPVDAASPASSCSSASSLSDNDTPMMSVSVKPDPDSPDSTLSSPSLSSSTIDVELNLRTRGARWARRKNQMRLKLDGISHHKRRPAKAPASEPGARLLEMFAELVDSRMESCQRMERLVREARQREYRLC